jgi:spore maturation protein CgeB
VRIVIVDAYYPRFLSHVLQQTDVTELGYRKTLDKLLRLRFGTADFYSRHLRALGHEADDIIFNCEPLQRRWAEEHGLFLSKKRIRIPARLARLPFMRSWAAANDTLIEIALVQIRKAKPDVLYLQDLNLFAPNILQSLKHSVGLIVGQIACPLPSEDYIKPFDLVLTSFPHYVDRLRAMGTPSDYFRIGFDPIVLDELGPVARKRSCTFVGGISPAHGGRTAFLEELARSVDMEFFGYGADTLPASSPILRKHHGEAWAMDMYRVLSESRITVNVHIDVAENFANNMRLYEATGCGALLVTDSKDNLQELFAVGKEVVAYRSPEEAIKLIKHYLDHPNQASEVANAGQARTLREHTYRHRMEELVDILRRYVKRRTDQPDRVAQAASDQTAQSRSITN